MPPGTATLDQVKEALGGIELWQSLKNDQLRKLKNDIGKRNTSYTPNVDFRQLDSMNNFETAHSFVQDNRN